MTRLGFFNLLLYSNGTSASNDITNGTNNGCGAEASRLWRWDAVCLCCSCMLSAVEMMVSSTGVGAGYA